MSIQLQPAPSVNDLRGGTVDLGRISPTRPLPELIADRSMENVLCEDARFLINDVCTKPVEFDQHFCLRYVGDFFRSVNPTFMEVERRIAESEMLCHPFSAPYLVEAITAQAKFIRGESVLVLSSRISFERYPHLMRITRKNPAAPWKVAIYRIENALMKMARDCPIIIASHTFET